MFFFFKQKTAYDMRISDWSSDVCSSDLVLATAVGKLRRALHASGENRIVTVPRLGYRLDGPVERVALGQRLGGTLTFEAGQPVPGREHFLLEGSEERRGGKECARTCRYRWSPEHSNKKKLICMRLTVSLHIYYT